MGHRGRVEITLCALGVLTGCSVLFAPAPGPQFLEFEACWQADVASLELRNPRANLLEGRMCLAVGEPQVLAVAGRARSQILAVLDAITPLGEIEQVTVLRDAANDPANDTVIARLNEGPPTPPLARSTATPCPCPVSSLVTP